MKMSPITPDERTIITPHQNPHGFEHLRFEGGLVFDVSDRSGGGDATVEKLRLNSDGATITGNLDLAADGDTILLGTGDDFQISFDGTNGVIKGIAGVQNVNVWTENTAKYQFTSGAIRPLTNNAYDLGDSSLRWRDIYTNDLNLSNEGGANVVDGTWGDYTIQEGESDLFLINNRSGKKFKFNLTEVS